jgi:predicted PurR-regulated permease PerM
LRAVDGPATSTTRLRVTVGSIVAFVVILGLGLVARNVIASSVRVLGWLAAAVIVAALLHPAVAGLSRFMPRALALVLVVVATIAAVGGLAYATLDHLRHEATKLQEAAPEAAMSIERSQRFGNAAREFGLTERVTELVKELPSRVTGGTGDQSLTAAATRGFAYVAGIVLTVFLLLHGPRMVDGALRQLADDTRRANARRILRQAYERWWRYVVLNLARGVVVGVLGYLACRLFALPGAFLLGVALGVFSLVPYLGVLVGSLPIVLLALGLEPSSPRFVILLLGFVGYQVFEAFAVQPQLDRRSIRIGPVLPLVVAMVAFELYGLGGALYGIAAAVLVVSVLDELAPTDADAVDLDELEKPLH